MSPTPHLDDDRLSALLDGEASTDDEQHADGCPECHQRVAAWRATAGKLAVWPPPVATARRQAAVEAALAELEPAPTPSPDQPLPLAAHRRRWATFSWPRFAGAAAAVVVVAGIAVAISQIGGGGPSPSSTAAGVTRPPAGSRAPQASGNTGPSKPSAAPAAGAAIGSFEDPAGVVAALRARLNSTSGAGLAPGSVPGSASGSPAGPPSAVAPVSPPCLAQAVSGAKVAPHSTPVLDVTLTYRGSPARAYVFAVAGRYAAAVVGGPGCVLLAVATF